MPWALPQNVLATLACCLLTAAALAQLGLDSTRLVNAQILELLKAEVLDTVSLDQPIHFFTTQTTDVVLPPGTYRVMEGDPQQLKFMSLKGNKTIVVSALSSHHQERVATPIALHVRDDDKFPHVLLLLPDGQALEAVGSYDATRSRGVRSFQLTPIQIQKALREKLQQMGK